MKTKIKRPQLKICLNDNFEDKKSLSLKKKAHYS